MLNKNCIKTILNVKHTCIDKVTMLADTSIMIQVHATFLGPDMAPALHANLKNRLLGWLLTVLV